jgi:hypothetical protein
MEIQAFLDKMPNDTILTFETYDGSGQVVHPDVFWVSDSLLLALTPYPLFMADYENPSLFFTKNGKNYSIPRGIHNPLIEKPKTGYNCDPDIFIDGNGKLNLFYLEVLNDSIQSLKKIVFENDFTYKNSNIFTYNPKNGDDFVLSPASIYSKDKFELFYIKLSDKQKNTIKYSSFKDLESISNRGFKTLPLNLPNDFTPWHLDVVKHQDYYYLLINGYYGKQAEWNSNQKENYTLYITKSKDLKNWTNIGNVLHRKNVPIENLKYLYRSSALITEKNFGIWYSFVENDNVWKIGFKKIKR